MYIFHMIRKNPMGLSFEVKAYQTVVIVTAGAGKTSLINLIETEFQKVQ